MKSIKIVILLMLSLLLTNAYSADRQSRYLEITDLLLQPNPFTPYSHHFFSEQNQGEGLRISFKVETQARFVWVTGKIYNTRGEHVKTISELEPVYSSRGPGDIGEPVELVYWWNGMTEFNRLAHNGRYIFHLKVSDSEAQTFYQEKVTTFILVK